MNKQKKFLFFPVPRCASATILTHLGLAPGKCEYRPVSTVEAKETHFSYTAAFVRNPWDRLVSAYSFLSIPGQEKRLKMKIPSSFKGFVELLCSDAEKCFAGAKFEISANPLMKDFYLRPQAFLLNEEIDFVGKYSKLQQDVNILSRKVQKPVSELSLHLRKTNHKNYSSYYDTKTKKSVEKLYAYDIDKWNFTFES